MVESSRFSAESSQNPDVRLLVGVVGISLLLSGFCGIISELSLFNLAETLIGGTNANLTSTMGLMMFAMGVGAALAAHRWFRHVSVEMLIGVEILLSLTTMSSVAVIYTFSGWFPGSAAAWIWVFSVWVGVLIGLEIPLVLRINEELGLHLRLNASLVMAPDYFGSLAAFVLFTFVLLPQMGLGHVAWLGGVLNLLVAALVALVFRRFLRRPRWTVFLFLVFGGVAGGLGGFMPGIMDYAEQLHYRDGIFWSRTTPYQRLVVTQKTKPGNLNYSLGPLKTKTLAQKGAMTLKQVKAPAVCGEDIRLFINGGLQFSTCDEHRYHEMLVHPAATLVPRLKKALVLGGGDGMGVRELLKYPKLLVTLVDLDEKMVRLFTHEPLFSRLNNNALKSDRVEVVVMDAFRFLRETTGQFDLIVMDFPDPYHTVIARLYSLQFFKFAHARLSPGGILVTQSMSPLYQPEAFLSVKKTMKAAGLSVISLQVPMLTFEHWGFQVGSKELSSIEMGQKLDDYTSSVPTRFLNAEAMQAAHRWGKQTHRMKDIPVNDQFTLPLAELYQKALKRR